MRSLFTGLAAMLLFCGACTPATTKPPSTVVVPLKSLRLYETGVGYFERTGQVAGDNVLPVPTGHLDDALKSLVILGAGAKVQGLTFSSHLSRPLARALVGLPELSDTFAYRDLLSSLKGAPVELSLKRGEVLRGRLVETFEEIVPAPHEESGAKAPSGERKEEPPRKTTLVMVLTEDGTLRRVSLDEITGVKPLDPAFASRLGASLDATAPRSAQVQRALRLLGDGGPVTFGYIAETPVWRTSYRVLLDGSTSAFQGWALLHNDTDEDWRSVQLTLVNGRPDSFLFPLAAPRYLRRELVHPDQALPTVPQLLGQNVDEMWGDSFGAGGLGLSGVGEGGGGRGEGIGLGSIGTIGHGSGVGASSSGLLSVGNLASVAQASGSEQGALFSYAVNQPLSLPAHSSALVPFLEQKMPLKLITWIEDGARAGVRFENTTGQTLPAGTVAFFSGGGFAGESTLERLKPGERRFITFGADLDVELDKHEQQSKEETKRVTAVSHHKEGTKRVTAVSHHIEEHFLRTTEHTITLQNRSPSPRTVYLVLRLNHNAQVTGADALDYDTAQNKPVAIFELAAKQKLERTFVSVEGLSRGHYPEQMEPESLQKMAEQPQLPAEEKAGLRELAARRTEQLDTTRSASALDAEMSELQKELERQQKHLEALGGDKTQRPDANPFVKRILAAEDRLADARKRRDALQKQVKARHEAVMAALQKLGARK